MKKLFVALLVFAVAHNAGAMDTKARNAFLMDADTGAYLFEKDAFAQVPPASMSKLMTVYILFSKLKDGSLSLEDEFSVSENAWRKGGAASGGSTMFLPINSKVSVDNLLKGIIIQSGNDACIVAAENIAGSEEDFATIMNEKAKELGLKNSHFANATGLPDANHLMSMEDLAKLARVLIKDFGEYYHLFSDKSFVYNNIKQGNRNPLLYSMQGADGLKTGHTEEAGFCLTASAMRNGRRLIGAMSGMKSEKERSEEAEKLMSWGFREFDNYKLFKAYQKITAVPVFMGKEDTIDLIVNDDVVVTLPRNEAKDAKLTAVYNSPAVAPIKIGDKLGELKIETAGMETKIIPLYADQSIEEKGFFGRMFSNIAGLVFGGY